MFDIVCECACVVKKKVCLILRVFKTHFDLLFEGEEGGCSHTS